MSFSSSECRPANRAAGHLIIILLALLLAGISAGMPRSADSAPKGEVEQRALTAPVALGQAAPADAKLHHRGHRPASAGSEIHARSYHLSFETSDSAGALGFWILSSLCAALLMGGFAPWLAQWVRRRG